MILDNEGQRTLLLGMLQEMPITGNYEQLKQAVANLNSLIMAVKAAEVKEQEKKGE